MLQDIGRELLNARFDGSDQVSQESNGMGDDQLDRLPPLLEHSADTLFELAQDLDYLAKLVYEFGDKALVLLLHLLELLIRLVGCLFVALCQFLGKGILLLIDTPSQLFKAASNFFFSGFPHCLQVFGETLDIFPDTLLPLRNFVLGFFKARLDGVGDTDYQCIHFSRENLATFLVKDIDFIRWSE